MNEGLVITLMSMPTDLLIDDHEHDFENVKRK